jgi:hypothetical protein
MLDEKKEVYTLDELVAKMEEWQIELLKDNWKKVKFFILFLDYAEELGMTKEFVESIEWDDIELALFPKSEPKSIISHEVHQILADEAYARRVEELDALANSAKVSKPML